MTDVIILAAGQGTRLRPLTHDRPKSMLLVAGQPLVEHLLRDLSHLGVQRAILVTGHGHEALQSFVGDGSRFGMTIEYVTQAKQLGPGHALMQARHLVKGDEFVLLPADAWYAPTVLADLLDHPGSAILQVPDARSARHGLLVVRSGRVVGLEPAPNDPSAPMTHASGGAYRLPCEFLSQLDGHTVRIEDALRHTLKAGPGARLVDVAARSYVDVIEVQDLLDLHGRLMSQQTRRIDGKVEPGAIVIGPVAIGAGTIIHPGCVIQGPVTIGEHCEVGPGAILQPGTSLRNQVRVGPFALLSDCIVGSNVQVDSHVRLHRTYVDRGVQVGSGCHVPGGTGTILGADAVLSADARVQAGGTIGRGAQVASGRTVLDVPDGGLAV